MRFYNSTSNEFSRDFFKIAGLSRVSRECGHPGCAELGPATELGPGGPNSALSAELGPDEEDFHCSACKYDLNFIFFNYKLDVGITSCTNNQSIEILNLFVARGSKIAEQLAKTQVSVHQRHD